MQSQPIGPLRQQKIEGKPVQTKRPVIEDLRQPKIQSPEAAAIPIRTVLYAEVGDLSREQVLVLLGTLNQQYADNRHGPHYIVPTRQGRIGTDVHFEAEFLDVVQRICEVRDGKITLRDGAKDVQVIRQQV